MTSPNLSSLNEVRLTDTALGLLTLTVYSTSPPVSGTDVGFAVLTTSILNFELVKIQVIVSPGSSSKSSADSVSPMELVHEDAECQPVTVSSETE